MTERVGVTGGDAMAGETVTTSVWIEEQLGRALERVEALAREVARLQAAGPLRDQAVDALREALATVDGRTQRHEAGLELARGLRQEVAALAERLAEESALRREQDAAGERGQERGQERGHAAEQALGHTLQAVGDRVGDVERALAAAQERAARLGRDLAGRDTHEEQVGGRLEALAGQVAALAADAQREVGGVARLDAAVAALQLAARSLEARTDGLRDWQQRFEDDIATVLRVAAREQQLEDVVEQQRVLRQRVEAGLAMLQERAAAAQVAQAAEGEERALLRARLGALEQRLGAVTAEVSGQREVLLEHFRRATAAAEEAGRREMEEIDRQTRANRELLVRLAERADETAREQPL